MPMMQYPARIEELRAVYLESDEVPVDRSIFATFELIAPPAKA